MYKVPMVEVHRAWARTRATGMCACIDKSYHYFKIYRSS